MLRTFVAATSACPGAASADQDARYDQQARENACANPTTRAIRQTVITGNASLRGPDSGFVQRLLDGDVGNALPSGATAGERLRVTKKAPRNW